MKKHICLALALTLIATLIPAAFAPQPPLIADTYICASIGEPEFVDMHACYESAGVEIINNVYDHLVMCNKENVLDIVPQLAESWTISPDGLVWTFKIRSGVKFHNGAILTPEDCEYTFERAMVMDFSGGPCWMFFDPLLGMMSSREYDLTDSAQVIELGQRIDAAVESTADSLIFTMDAAYPEVTFLQILANSWSAILNKEWSVAQGGWPGEWGDYSGWAAYNNPEVPWLDDPEPVMMGTGPFKLDYWEKTVEYSVIKFDDYWGGWPAPGSRGFVSRVIYKLVTEWATRKLQFLAGDTDWCSVPSANILEMQEGGTPTGPFLSGINCFRGMPTGVLDALFFAQDIDPASPYIYSGALDGAGAPANFFSDVHVRRTFAYCFDYEAYIRDAHLGEAVQPRTVLPEELGYLEYINPDIEHYTLDLGKAEAEIKLAWGGEVWDKGFKMTLCYNAGNTARKTVCDVLSAGLSALNPKFQVDSLALDWPTFLSSYRGGQLPCLVLGWHHDFVDPHNWFQPFMHTYGDFSFFSAYSNPTADALIEGAIRELDPDARKAMYYDLQQIYFDDVPNVPTTSRWARRYDRTWVCGYFSNNLVACRWYYIWKQIVPPNTGYPVEDVVQDGKINIIDISNAAKAFGASLGHPRWSASLRADVDRNAVVNIVDLAKIAKLFGTNIPGP